MNGRKYLRYSLWKLSVMLDLKYNYIIGSLIWCGESLNCVPSEVVSELRYQH